MVTNVSKGLKIVGAIITACFLSLILFATLSRFILNRPIDYSDELVALMFVVCAFIGILSSVIDNDHIVVNIFTQKLPDRYKTLCKRISFLISALFFGFLTFQTFKFASFSYQIGALTENAAIPISYWMYIMPVTSAVATLFCVYRIFVVPSKGSDGAEELLGSDVL